MKAYDSETNRRVQTIGRQSYVDADPDGWDGAYTVADEPGIAWRVFGWEVEYTEDTEWDGIMLRTGRLVCVMVGDDRPYLYDPDELTPLDRVDYCGECGQVGCGHDGLDRA
jgi:hypothetical protein